MPMPGGKMPPPPKVLHQANYLWRQANVAMALYEAQRNEPKWKAVPPGYPVPKCKEIPAGAPAHLIAAPNIPLNPGYKEPPVPKGPPIALGPAPIGPAPPVPQKAPPQVAPPGVPQKTPPQKAPPAVINPWLDNVVDPWPEHAVEAPPPQIVFAKPPPMHGVPEALLESESDNTTYGSTTDSDMPGLIDNMLQFEVDNDRGLIHLDNNATQEHTHSNYSLVQYWVDNSAYGNRQAAHFRQVAHGIPTCATNMRDPRMRWCAEQNIASIRWCEVCGHHPRAIVHNCTPERVLALLWIYPD